MIRILAVLRQRRDTSGDGRSVLLLWLWICTGALSFASAAEASEAPRLAFLATTPDSEKWVSLFVGTREPEEVTLLDRGASDALMTERSIFLQASGTGEPDFDLREWVSADVLVMVETVEGDDKKSSSDLMWFRALDVVTGVRLMDEILEVDLQKAETGLEKMDTLLRKTLLPSWRTLWGEDTEFAGVSLMDIRLVDAGMEDRHTFSSLYRMLQQMIVQDPSIVLVERNLLENLTREEALSPSLKLKLRAGMILLSGSVHQETGGAVFTLRGSRANQHLLFEETFLLDGSIGPADLAARTRELYRHHLSSPGAVHPVNLREEAKRFHQLATTSYASKRPERALEAAFAAQALAPHEPQYTRTLYKIYYEQVKGDVLKLKSPEPEALRDLMGEVHHLFLYQSTMEGYPFEDDSAHNLLETVKSRFGDQLSEDPSLQATWDEINALYHRSLEKVLRRETSLSNTISEQERDAHIRALVETHRPVIPHHFRLLFGVYPRTGKLYWSNPIAQDVLHQLRDITEDRPYMSGNSLRKQKPPFDAVLDDLYIRNLMLAALNELAGDQEKAGVHFRQLALLILQNPPLFKQNLFYIERDASMSFRKRMREAFRELRKEIEREGWFLPELYDLSDPEVKPEVVRKAFDPKLRLVSIAQKPGQYLSERQELSIRLTHRNTPATLPEENEAFPDYEDLDIRSRGDQHARIWGDRLVTMVRERPRDGFSGDTLQVYEKSERGIEKVQTVRFPGDRVEGRIDTFNDKRFYRSLLGGKEHLYYTHRHSLFQFDAEMNTSKVLHLADWGFPDHMVANLLETPLGVFVVLTKQHLHKKYAASGRLSGGSVLNNGGVLILASHKLELQEILANIERPTPRNALEGSGPFGARAMYLDESGTVQLAAYRHSKGASSWFEIGEDLVPRKRKYPGNSERMEVWISSFPAREGQDLDAMRTFCQTHGSRFGLKYEYLPGMRLGGPFEFRKVVPFGKGVVVLKNRSHGPNSTLPSGLYVVPNHGRPEQARLLMELKGNELFETLFLWGEDIVLTGRSPQHRIFRKEILKAFLRKRPEGRQGPFPSQEHVAAQQAFQQEWSKLITAYQPPEGISFEPEPLDHLIRLPGGAFPLHPRTGGPQEHPTVTFPPFSMSDTLVTHAEFYRVYKWAIHHGYRFSRSVDFNQALDKLSDMPDRPEVDLSIVDAKLYCNARSEWEGRTPAYYLDAGHERVLRTSKNSGTYKMKWTNDHVNWNAGYRLPTEAEWEYVARGADPNHTARYPWGDTISHRQASYLATDFHTFDRSTGGLHPAVAGQDPPICRVKTFPPHGFENRFYGMVGNVAELVWDRREWEGQDGWPVSDPPRSPIRNKGGSWATTAGDCTIRASLPLGRSRVRTNGFRVVLPKERSEDRLRLHKK